IFDDSASQIALAQSLQRCAPQSSTTSGSAPEREVRPATIRELCFYSSLRHWSDSSQGTRVRSSRSPRHRSLHRPSITVLSVQTNCPGEAPGSHLPATQCLLREEVKNTLPETYDQAQNLRRRSPWRRSAQPSEPRRGAETTLCHVDQHREAQPTTARRSAD